MLHPIDSLQTVIERLGDAPYHVLPVVDGENRLLGVVDLEEVHFASQAPSLSPLIVAEDMMRSDVRPLTPDDTLDRAQELFVENDLLALPIVNDLKAAAGDRHGAALRHRQRLSATAPRVGGEWRVRSGEVRVERGQWRGRERNDECGMMNAESHGQP